MRKKSNKFWEHARSKLSAGVSVLKFRYSEKATKFEKIVSTVLTSKKGGIFFSNFVAFSQYLNFKNHQ